MTLPRYGRYRDSGVEWLGEVPAHWQVTRLKFIAHVQTGIAKGKDNTGKDTVEVPYLRVANVQDGYLDLEDVATIEIPADDLPRYQLRAGDVLMNEGGDFDKLGRGHVWDGSIDPCIHQNHVFAVRPFGASPHWLNLITGSAYAQFYFMSRSKQSTNLASISSTNVMELPVVMPPAAEQERIAAFLSHETATIDRLIDEQRRLIDLLTEKRQAVIAHAVTKGMDLAAPRKDSGVEWLAEVPAHWSVQPLKHVASFRSGGTPDKGNFDYWDGDIPWASAKDLKVDHLFDTGDHITVMAVADGAASLVPAGSVLVVVRGMILARTFPVVTARVPMAINQDLKAVMARAHVSGEFLAWLLRASAEESLSRLDEAGHGTKALRMDAWGEMRVPVPPLAEQVRIAEHLNSTCSKTALGLLDVQLGIALLQERRTALISAAVTGQIDVRNTTASAKADAACAPAC
ncbi:MAG: restriction endonuclease subunit S [Burkholderiaceae bacterium]|nr:restriction endonuclease subunit S [Burkholderiaceae bacterium]